MTEAETRGELFLGGGCDVVQSARSVMILTRTDVYRMMEKCEEVTGVRGKRVCGGSGFGGQRL